MIISAFILLISSEVSSQTYSVSQPADTIILQQINFKKVLAYNIGGATVLVDYDDFMKSFVPFWKKYKKGVQSLEKSKEENPSYVRRFNFLDATYKRLTAEIKAQDTVFISDISFRLADIGTSYDFTRKIEQGRCIVLDKNNIRQTFILRQKHSYQKGPLDGWGGRLYFISGQKEPFIRGTDWVS